SCDGVRGALARIAAALDPDVAIVVSGHTHRAYNCRHGGRVLTQAGSYGRVVTVIDFKLDSRTGQIRRDGIAAHNLPVINSAAEDPALNAAYPASVADAEVAAMVASWSERAPSGTSRRASSDAPIPAAIMLRAASSPMRTCGP